MNAPRNWDGSSYDRVSGVMETLGREVLDRLPLRGDETVLDAGCGSGRVTQALIDRLPRGRVIGVDGSADMIRVAAERLPAGTELLVQDLAELDLGGRTVDAILSTATFHWIPDHPRLFAALRRALAPGGRLVVQCGGAGNVARVAAAASHVGARAPYAPYLAGWPGPWNFSTVEDAVARLELAGFTDIEAELVPRPVTPEAPEEYLGTVMLGSHVARLPEEHRAAYVAEVHAQLGGGAFVADYVRLNVDATAA